MRNQILIEGQLLSTLEFSIALEKIKIQRDNALTQPCPTALVLKTCQAFADYIVREPSWLNNFSSEIGVDELDSLKKELSQFCQQEYLTQKLHREFKTASPLTIRRPKMKENIFEGWQPLGCVVHITPSNAISLPFMAIVEGLLAGNFNILRPGHKDFGLSAILLHQLISLDISGELAKYIVVVNAPKTQLYDLMKLADGVSAWGGDDALNALRAQIPNGCRFIEWGHKLSFAYLDPIDIDDQWYDNIAKDVCQFDQQACSSPQILLVNTTNWNQLLEVGIRMSQAMHHVSDWYPNLNPSPQETAEITTQIHLAQLESALDLQKTKIWEDPKRNWRIILSDKPGISPSPLFRTLLISPAPAEELVALLLPFRPWLQTCALIAEAAAYPSLAQKLITAGVTRITSAGAMHQEYAGEPHDGVYALPRLARRISISPQETWKNNRASINATQFEPADDLEQKPIMKKADFIAQGHNQNHAQIYFQSGGTSGKPKLAAFSYADYHLQMQTAADGILAAGLDPNKDCVMNLLYAGNLYGGFHCYSTVLDKLEVRQLPMAGPSIADLPFVARIIVDQGVNTLIGMPNTLFLLFSQQKELLSEYRGIKKIFYGGEFMGAGQRALYEEMGVELIRSAMYGSVDAGILGYACTHTVEGTFHLITETQALEILELEADIPVKDNQVGRLIFSSNREAQPLSRYEIGDIGRWITSPCSCGSTQPTFELLGRIGDVIKIGTYLIDCNKIKTWIEQHTAYQGMLQIRLDYNLTDKERMTLCFSETPSLSKSALKQGLTKYYKELLESIEDELLIIDFEYNIPLTQNQHSGKFPLIIDLRLALANPA